MTECQKIGSLCNSDAAPLKFENVIQYVSMLPDLILYSYHAVCHIITPLPQISNYKKQTIQSSAVTFCFKFIETKGFCSLALILPPGQTPFDTKYIVKK